VTAERLHVTLAFLGTLSEPEAASAGRALADAGEALAALDPGELRVAEARALPPRRPRVAAAGLAGAGDGLRALQAHVVGRLAAAGVYEPEPRAFLPHVTVARARRGARPPRGLPPAPDLRFRPEAVTLFESRPSGAGPRYVPLASVALPGR
jgi:2'-5' RNA ligase